MIRRLHRILIFLALGLATTVGIALLMALLVDVQLGQQRHADNFDGDEHWTITRWDRAGAAQIFSTRVTGENLGWGPQQAAGQPNSKNLADQPTAWAAHIIGNPEWLILDYARAVVPKRVDVYENYTPGALSQVSIFDDQGKEIVAWAGVDPSPQNPPTTPAATAPAAVSKIPISLNIPTRRVKIYMASDKVKGWNEIDAVGLIDVKGETQWATRVKASSTYASVANGALNSQEKPEDLAPFWSGLSRRTKALEDGQINNEERRVDARGWPMLALKSETSTLGTSNPAAASTTDLELSDDLSLSAQAGSGQLRYTGISSSRSSGRSAFAITTPTPGPQMPVPFHPIWIGLIGDTFFFAAVWFGLWAALIIPRRFIREVARFRRGACIQCGYDLGYEFVHGCPECGWRRNGQTMPATPRSTVPQPMNRN